MGQITDKLRSTTQGFAWWCPGCEMCHPLPWKRGQIWLANRICEAITLRLEK